VFSALEAAETDSREAVDRGNSSDVLRGLVDLRPLRQLSASRGVTSRLEWLSHCKGVEASFVWSEVCREVD